MSLETLSLTQSRYLTRGKVKQRRALSIQSKVSRRKRGAAPKHVEEEDEEAAAAYIPTELREDILSSLPSTALLKFKLVCRGWLSLISSPEFIEKHLEGSKARNDPQIVVQRKPYTWILDCGSNTTRKILLGCSICLLGSCDGLVLYYRSAGFILGALNPATGKSESPIFIYLECEAFIVTWFGRHPATQEYVLVTSRMLMGEITFIVFSLSGGDCGVLLVSSSIKPLPGRNHTGSHGIGTMYRGRVHCHNGEFGTILAYDLESNEIFRMWCPVESRPVAIGVVDGCLSAIHAREEVYELWVMKEYGVEESWTKFAEINGGSNYVNASIPLIYPNGDVVFVENDSLKVKKYSIREREFKLLHTYACKAYIRAATVACIQSLLSPDIVWK